MTMGDKSHYHKHHNLHHHHKQTTNPVMQYLKEQHNLSLMICFLGILGFYSYYAYLQELL